MKKYNVWFLSVQILLMISCKPSFSYSSEETCFEGMEFFLPEDLIFDDGLFLYVEDHTCSPCLEKELLPLWRLFADSFPNNHPLVLVHSNDQKDEINLFHEKDSVFQIIVSNIDSIRERNSWIPKGRVYYGFILDSLSMVNTYGFFSNKSFVERCYLYYKERNDMKK